MTPNALFQTDHIFSSEVPFNVEIAQPLVGQDAQTTIPLNLQESTINIRIREKLP